MDLLPTVRPLPNHQLGIQARDESYGGFWNTDSVKALVASKEGRRKLSEVEEPEAQVVAEILDEVSGNRFPSFIISISVRS